MEFGHLDDISHVNWSLPMEDELSMPYLQSLKSIEPQIFIGAPAWGHAVWKGKIYPGITKPTDFLFHYSRSFSCIELNTSHYRIPTSEQAQKWVEQTPEGFLFCAKIYQGISHSEEGLTNKKLLNDWFYFLESLGSRRGPSFLQLSPHFDYSRRASLFEFLKHWPEKYELAVELRHPSWFQEGKMLPALVQYLQSRGIGLVITDVAGRRDVVHSSISAPFVLLRFIGNNLHPTDFERAEIWTQRFQHWFSQGLQRLFLMVHEPDDVSAPEMASFFIKKINDSGTVKHPELKNYKADIEENLLPGF